MALRATSPHLSLPLLPVVLCSLAPLDVLCSQLGLHRVRISHKNSPSFICPSPSSVCLFWTRFSWGPLCFSFIAVRRTSSWCCRSSLSLYFCSTVIFVVLTVFLWSKFHTFFLESVPVGALVWGCLPILWVWAFLLRSLLLIMLFPFFVFASSLCLTPWSCLFRVLFVCLYDKRECQQRGRPKFRCDPPSIVVSCHVVDYYVT